MTEVIKWHSLKAATPPFKRWAILFSLERGDYVTMIFHKLNRGSDIEFAKRNYTHWAKLDNQ